MHLRSAYRSAANPLDADQNLGFRICRNGAAKSEKVATSFALDITIPENPKILVAYFSYSGDTESAAKMIAEMTGAICLRSRGRTEINAASILNRRRN